MNMNLNFIPIFFCVCCFVFLASPAPHEGCSHGSCVSQLFRHNRFVCFTGKNTLFPCVLRCEVAKQENQFSHCRSTVNGAEPFFRKKNCLTHEKNVSQFIVEFWIKCERSGVLFIDRQCCVKSKEIFHCLARHEIYRDNCAQPFPGLRSRTAKKGS